MKSTRRPWLDGDCKAVSMNDKDLWCMTREEKEEFCQAEFGMSYDERIDTLLADLTPEEREIIKREQEYPKPE